MIYGAILAAFFKKCDQELSVFLRQFDCDFEMISSEKSMRY